jgi:hypothetical protein
VPSVRAALDRAVVAAFTDAKGMHGSPRLHDDLLIPNATVDRLTSSGSVASPRSPRLPASCIWSP